MLILFASRCTSPTDFRRIHDDRTPHVDPAAGAVVPAFSGLKKNDFVPNTIIEPACSERPLRLGCRPAEQFYKKNQKITTNGMGQLNAHPPIRRPSRQRRQLRPKPLSLSGCKHTKRWADIISA